MGWLLVTPARDEADRIGRLAGSLARQRAGDITAWVVVDDGSSDGTAALVRGLDLPFPVHVLDHVNEGGLLLASEFKAFLHGAEHGVKEHPDVDRVMKCDADIVLADDYTERCQAAAGSGLLAGLVVGERERTTFTRGPLKCYSRAAYEVIRELPAALGWDVLDEVAVRRAGMTVQTVPEAHADVSRRTGSSEGSAEGRRRGGIVSRWCGYDPVYFALRCLRYLARPPYGTGALAMARAWATAGPGPFDPELKRLLRAEQRRRLLTLLRSPVKQLRRLWGHAAPPSTTSR
ncbi:MAG: putative glycosyl transferase, family 2 [Frankiales bacterium]|nr:putative glycosyl transferase, family 2 [Frankiales bacterium]